MSDYFKLLQFFKIIIRLDMSLSYSVYVTVTVPYKKKSNQPILQIEDVFGFRQRHYTDTFDEF